MANIRGNILTYGQTGDVEDLADAIRDATASDTPLFSLLPRGSATDVEHRWIEDKLTSFNLTAGTITTSAASFTVSDGSVFTVGDYVAVDSEVMRITAVSTNTLTVTRGWGDSSSTYHANSTTVQRMANGLVEGADAITANSTTKSKVSNLTQIVTDTVLVTGTKRAIINVGGDEYVYQVHKKMKEHAIKWERAVLYGAISTGTSSAPSTMGGLRPWITSESSNRGGTLSKTQFETFLRGIVDNGGKPDTLVAGFLYVQSMNYWAAAAMRSKYGEKGFGTNINTITTLFGDLDIVPDRWLVTGSAFALQTDLLKFCPLPGRNTQLIKLAKTGDSDKAMILTEATLERSCEYAQGYQYGVTGGA